MRIMVLSNFYPPYVVGGYEQLCSNVVEGLTERGHEITVLSSTLGLGYERTEGNIHRLLHLESSLNFYRPISSLYYPWLKYRNREHLRYLLASRQPDIVFVWGMWLLQKELAAEAEQLLPNRVVYYLANPWPIEANAHQAYWEQAASRPWRAPGKQLLRPLARWWLAAEWQPVPLQFTHAPCCSAAQRQQLLEAGVPLQDAPVIYEGIKLAPHLAQAEERLLRYQKRQTQAIGRPSLRTHSATTLGTLSAWDTTLNVAEGVLERDPSMMEEPLQLLFVGNLAQHKGVHTILEALAKITPTLRQRLRLTILGAGHPTYVAQLRALVTTHQLENVVAFHAPIPRPDLPAFLGRYDVLILPSIWAEPLALIMQEGLASGLVVVGSATGGTQEIIRDGENGLLFPAGDASALAQAIERLIDNPELCQQLAHCGSRIAQEKFDLQRMINDLEYYLTNVSNHCP